MQIYKIEGMSCDHCVRSVTAALSKVAHVSRVEQVSLERGEAILEGSPDEQAVLAALREEGFEAKRVRERG